MNVDDEVTRPPVSVEVKVEMLVLFLASSVLVGFCWTRAIGLSIGGSKKRKERFD